MSSTVTRQGPRRIAALLLSAAGLTISVTSHAVTGKVFLMGGAVAQTNASIYDALRAATGKDWSPNTSSYSNCSTDWTVTACPRVAVVTSGAIDLATGDDVFINDDPATGTLSYYNLFQKWGFSPKHLELAIDNAAQGAYPNNPVGDANIAIINSADVIFFNGGDQSRHAAAWLTTNGADTPIMTALRARYAAGAVVSGTSAGTAIQGSPTHGEGTSYGYLYYNADLAPKLVGSPTGLRDDRSGLSGFRYNHNGGKMTGFGFIDNAAVDTHFDARGRMGRLIAALRNVGKSVGYGVGEDTAFYVNGDVGKVYGTNEVFVVDESTASFPPSVYFTATGVTVSVLTAGDTYGFSTKAVTSSKPLIPSPYYSGHYDSNAIFDPYETTKSLTRLVDQVDGYNRGTTQEKKPQFSVKFYKNGNTKGYYGNGRYTVVKALVDIY